MSGAIAGAPGRLTAVLALVLVTALAARLAAQSVSVDTTAGEIEVRAPGLRLMEGLVLERLREGRSVRVDFSLDVLGTRGGPVVARAQESFIVSFDLWEERFAVTRTGAPRRSISHQTAGGAEAWCLRNITVPVAALGRAAGDTPFWIRLTYRVPPDASAGGGEDDGFTLRTLIDRLSRRDDRGELTKSVEAGPFRIPN